MSRLSLCLGALAVAALAGCADEAPRAALTVTPNQELAPIEVSLDASASSSPKSPASALSARFDFDGDGSWDSDFGPLRLSHLYPSAGRFTPKVELRDAEGLLAQASAALEVRENHPPVVVLRATPEQGPITLEVNVDASGSSDPDQEASGLKVRFDFDGDGSWDTAASEEVSARYRYRSPGSYTVRAELSDSRGLSAVGELTVRALPYADLDADSDHDGRLTEADDDGEESWGGGRGAVFLANLDDDDGDGRPDGQDEVLNGTEDLADMAVLVARQHPDLEDSDQVQLSFEPDGLKVRLFREEGDGTVSLLLGPESGSGLLPASELKRGDVRLFLEAARPRGGDWDGSLGVRLSIEHGGQTQEDLVALRLAPVIFPDNTQTPEILYVMKIADPQNGENLEFFNALQAGLPDSVQLYAIDEFRYGADRWAQDNMQTGYQEMPVEGGAHVLHSYLQTQRPTGPQGLEAFVPNEVLGVDHGYIYPGGRDTSLDYGGNLEVAPPHSAGGVQRPFGRIIVGGGNLGTLRAGPYEDHMAEAQVALLEAQNAQGPAVEVSTEWLVVGHIDEILQFVPSDLGARGFKVVLASPRLAKEVLDRLESEGKADLAIFAGRFEQTSVAAVLANDDLMSLNEAAQARIDTVREILVRELELTEDDFVEVPVLYEGFSFDGLELAAAFNPGVQNLVTIGRTLFIPDPEGPDDDGEDAWQRPVRERLEPLGLSPVFVDVFESYHVNLGEAHCGTEVQHTPRAQHWWDVE